jgi:RhtB (resistance to homoserine/threonine) family protein
MFLQEFISIAVIHFLAVIVPGPDFALILNKSISIGRRVAILCSLGLGIGILCHAIFAIFGLSLLISYSPVAFNIIKILGGLYLVYIGLSILGIIKSKETKSKPKGKFDNPIFQGFLTNILNPKVIIFFIAIFSQIVSPNTILGFKLLYGLEMGIATTLWFTFVAVILTNPNFNKLFSRYIKVIEKITAIVMIIFGLKTLFDK